MSDKKILILGHKGKIGSQLMIYLESQSYKIITFEGYLHPKLFREFLQSHLDITHVINTISKFKGSRNELFASNVDTVNTIILTLLETGIKPKIIHFSSAGVYASTQIIKDEKSLADPSTYYLLCKSLADTLLSFFKSDFNITILRPGGVFGEHIHDGFIYNMEYAAKNKGEVQLIGSSEKTRSILHIDYLLLFIQNIIEKDPSLDIINLSTQTTTLQKFIIYLEHKYQGLSVIKKDDVVDNEKLSHMNIDNSLAKSIIPIYDRFIMNI